MNAIEVVGLTKRYGTVTAVDGIDLRVAPGEIYAFVGLNGAGKTTTIRALLGMVRPTTGSIALLGEQVGAGGRGPWARVGHLVESPVAYPELTVRENLELSRRLHGVSDSRAVGDVIALLRLGAYADRRAGTLSLGNLQRLGLARALLHRPALLLLDEPSNGLDPAGVVEVRELLLRMAREEGVTIFLSSHLLTEVDRLAGRIGIIHGGRMLEELDAGALESRRRRRVSVTVRDPEAAIAALAAAGCLSRQAADGTIEIEDAAAIAAPDEVARLLVGAGTPPMRLIVEQDDLEAHFLDMVRGA